MDDYTQYDKHQAQQHVNGIMDQAEALLKPQGFEVVLGYWEDVGYQFIVCFQRDHGSAFNSVVVLLEPDEIRYMCNTLTTLLDSIESPE